MAHSALSGYLLLFFLNTNFVTAQLRDVKIAFTINEKDLFPEGIAYDHQGDAFYIGSIYKSKIIRITKTGTVTNFVKSNDNGLAEVLGLRIDVKNKHLLACSNPFPGDSLANPAVFRYDLASGELIKKYEWVKQNDKPYFNDIVVLQNGNCIITDSYNNSLYIIRKNSGQIEQFLETDALASSNGIALSPDGKKIIVSTKRGLLLVDLITKESTILQNKYGYHIMGLDGIYTFNNSIVGIQNIIFPYSINSYKLDLSEEKITEFQLLVADHPLIHHIPTTGAIVGNWFYFIGNSQIENLDAETRTIKQPQKLQKIQILKIKL